MVVSIEFSSHVAQAVEKKDLGILARTEESLNRILLQASDMGNGDTYSKARQELRRLNVEIGKLM